MNIQRLITNALIKKTFILQQLFEQYKKTSLLLNGEDFEDRDRLSKRTSANYRQLIGSKKLLLIDEAQNIPEIGKVLKLLIDTVKGITVIATGSSSFDLINKTGEPLVGRSYTFHLYPVAQRSYSFRLKHARGNDQSRSPCYLVYHSYLHRENRCL